LKTAAKYDAETAAKYDAEFDEDEIDVEKYLNLSCFIYLFYL